MADTPDSGGGLAGLLGIFGRGYDPAAAYSGLLADPATKDAMTFRALAGMAGAFAEGAMPVPYRGGVPFAATLGRAGQAAYAGQDQLIKARTEAAQQALYGAQGELARSQVGLNKILGPAHLALIEQAQKEAAAGGPLSQLQGAGGTKPVDASGGAGGVPGADGGTYWTAEGLAALRPTEGKYDQIHYPSGNPSTASGGYGFLDSTWKEQAGPEIAAKWPRAYMAPPEVQDAVAARTPIHHWTGVDANGKPFNAAAQKLATNPAFVTSGASGAAAVASLPVPGGLPPSLIAQVPNATERMNAPGGGLLAVPPEALPPPGAAPPGPAAAAGGATDAAYRRTLSAAAQGPGAWRRAVDAQELADPSGTRFNVPLAAGATPVPPVTSIPGGTNGIVPPGAPGPQGGLLGPTLPPEALASLGLVSPPGGRPAQFAGPGAADPTAPPGAPGPNLVSGLPPPLSPGGALGGLLAPQGAGPPAGMPAAAPGPGPVAPIPAAPPAAPTGPPVAPPLTLPPLPTTMPPMPTMAAPAATPAQKMAQGIAGISALTGHPAPAWIQDLAKMPAQMQLEQYKAWVTAQAGMMTKQYEKQLEIAGAGTISYLQDQGKLPGDLTRRTQEQDLILRNELAKKGMTIGPDGKFAIDPNYLAIEGQLEGQKQTAIAAREKDVAAANAQFQTVEARVLGPDGQPKTEKMTQAEFTRRRQDQQMGAAPKPGDIIGDPYKSPSDLRLEESDIKLLDQKRALADTARTTIENANDLRRTIEQGVVAGAGADTRTQMLKLGQLLGITGTDSNQLIANTENYIALQGKNLKEGLSGLGPPISRSDTDIAERIAGGQMTTVQGMLEILRIREKYHRQAIVDYNQMASKLPPSPIIGDRTIREPPTYGARIAEGKNGARVWEKPNGEWVPF